MLLDLELENLSWAILRVSSTCNGEPVIYDFKPGEIRVITLDTIWLGDCYRWYDIAISFPFVEPNLKKPVILHGPKVRRATWRDLA